MIELGKTSPAATVVARRVYVVDVSAWTLENCKVSPFAVSIEFAIIEPPVNEVSE